MVHPFVRGCPCQSDICHLILTLFSWFNDVIKKFSEKLLFSVITNGRTSLFCPHLHYWMSMSVWHMSSSLFPYLGLPTLSFYFILITSTSIRNYPWQKSNSVHKGEHVPRQPFHKLTLNILMHKNSLWPVFHPLVQAGETFIASSFCYQIESEKTQRNFWIQYSA